LIRIPAMPGRTADYRPETGQTWGTFVPAGDVPPPPGLSLHRKPEPPKAPGK
jgi:hypothetical protein